MAYNPRTALDILNNLRAGIIGRSQLTDLNPVSALSVVLQAVAEEFASVERRLFILREGFYLRTAVGADLDEHIAQLPPVGISRIEQTNASAACLRVERESATTSLTIPAGSLVGSSSGITYKTTVTTIMSVGELSASNIHIVATVAGTRGNAAIGAIQQIRSMPSEITAVINEQPLTNGLDRESDADLRSRALLYLKSLSRCSRTMLEFLGTSFVGENGDRFSYARLYEDPNVAGYSELVGDDGSGITVASVSKAGRTAITNIATGGQAVAYHDAPATQDITASQIIVWRNADPTQQIGVSPTDFKSIPERGVVYFNAGVLQQGDRVFIVNYSVFTGLIAELQREVDGDPNNFDRITGFRAAGTRVAVRPVFPQFISFDVQLLASTAADYRIIETRVIIALESFINSLLPGQPLYISKLIEVARAVVGVKDIHFYEAGTTEYASNIFPNSVRTAIRMRRNSINISSAAN